MEIYNEHKEEYIKEHKEIVKREFNEKVWGTAFTFVLILIFIPGLPIWGILSTYFSSEEILTIGGSVITLLFIIVFLKLRNDFIEPDSFYSEPTEEKLNQSFYGLVNQNQKEVSSFKERLREKYEIISTGIDKVDQMEGYEFEEFIAILLKKLGYKDVFVTKKSGDGGVDILAINPEGEKTAIQCKRMNSRVSNSAVQEIFLGKRLTRCKKGMIITNSYLTQPAFSAAVKAGIEVWARNRLIEEMKKLEPKFTWEEYLASYYLKPEGKEKVAPEF
jgi:restriction system protein